MATRNQDVEMFKGNDIVISFTLTNSDGTFPDLTSATAIEFGVAATAASTTNEFVVSKPSMTISGANNNIVSIPIAATDVASMSAGAYYLELMRTIAGDTITSAVGTFFLRDSIHD